MPSRDGGYLVPEREPPTRRGAARKCSYRPQRPIGEDIVAGLPGAVAGAAAAGAVVAGEAAAGRIAGAMKGKAPPRGAARPRVIDPKTLPKPPGMSNAQLGDLLKWPAGPGTHASQIAQAERLIQGLNAQRLAAIRQAGFTKEMALRWAEFYEAEAIRIAQNVNAAARAAYLRALAALL